MARSKAPLASVAGDWKPLSHAIPSIDRDRTKVQWSPTGLQGSSTKVKLLFGSLRVGSSRSVRPEVESSDNRESYSLEVDQGSRSRGLVGNSPRLLSGESMRCSSCGSENLKGAKFCDRCGAPFPSPCPSCGAANRTGARFCNECGAALGPAPTEVKVSGLGHSASRPVLAPEIAVSVSVEAENVPEGERKLVTALFADIRGSTELMEDLD